MNINSLVTNPVAEDRATPPCPHFGPCGGCQLQHLTYPAQLDLKAARLRALLEPTTLSLPEIQLHPSPPFAYRNRIRLTLAEVDGQLRAGYITTPVVHRVGCPTACPEPAEGSGFSDVGSPLTNNSETGHSILPITQCPIAAPILWRAAEAFLTLNQTPVWLRNPQQILDQLELFTTSDESHLQFTLYLRTQAKTVPAKLTAAFTTFCESLRAQIPELTGAGIALLAPASTDRSRRTEIPRPGPTWGVPGLNYQVAGTTYWVPRTAFFQINRFLLPELLALVIFAADAIPEAQRTLAWDLYAGVGLFSKALTRTFAQVVAVEIAEPAATALASTKLRNLQAIKATTLDFLRATVIQRDRPNLIVLDPPRSGAGPEICALLARIAAPTLIYVSCSPQTLPADLVTLTASGYSVSGLHFVDLFPQTTHLETVTILTR